MREIVIVTQNPDKFKEIKAIISDLPLNILSLGNSAFPEEKGKSLEENAIKKAEFGHKLTNKTCIADDTGLEVYSLRAMPGVYSARFAGAGASYEANRKKLLELLGTRPLEERKAKFRCIVAIVEVSGKPSKVLEGEIEGYITQEERGNFGFGYDSIFLVPEYGKTLAEISPELKNRISHRARALLKLKEYLKTQLLVDSESERF